MSSSTSQTASARRLQERTAQRAVTAERKKKAAEALKDKGNEFYRNGKYKEALKCYEDAILEYGPRAVYLNNLAATLLKLERYVEAESAAFQALERDHKLLKARFRRGLARKGNQCYHGAFADFTNVLEQDPTCVEAAVELREVARCLDDDRLPCMDSAEDMTDDEKPLPGDHDQGYETGYESDSSDYHHKGNGRPCRFYNHGGCNRGASCKFKHAPDDRSVRDKLGRNVCVLYILGLCHFPESKCWYAHDKTHLPRLFWDSDPEIREMNRTVIKSCLKKRSPIKLEAYVRILNLNNMGPMAIPRTKEETFANNTRTYRSPWTGILDYEPGIDELLGWVDEYDDENYGDDDGDDGEYDDFDDDDGAMLGFSSDEVQELLAQGVKPWDDDAADVMAALRSF